MSQELKSSACPLPVQPPAAGCSDTIQGLVRERSHHWFRGEPPRPSQEGWSRTRGCFADPEPWSPSEGSRWGIARCLSPLQRPVKRSFPERLGRDGTSLLSGLIAHVRCIYRSDCLCRAQQTNRLLFCQAPFVIGGGWEHFNAAIIWRPHLYCRHQPRAGLDGACGIPSPGSGAEGSWLRPGTARPHPTHSSRLRAHGSLRAGHAGATEQPLGVILARV